MRRFLITSPAFTGEADILYDETGRLVKLDVMSTDMPPAIVNIFKEKIPVKVENLTAAFESNRATIVETSFEVSFDMFWQKYDKKINRKRCELIWAKLSKADQVSAFYGIDKYTKYLKTKESWRSKADPEKYLKDRYWENDWK